jgi:hypothetical protein
VSGSLAPHALHKSLVNRREPIGLYKPKEKDNTKTTNTQTLNHFGNRHSKTLQSQNDPFSKRH